MKRPENMLTREILLTLAFALVLTGCPSRTVTGPVSPLPPVVDQNTAAIDINLDEVSLPDPIVRTAGWLQMNWSQAARYSRDSSTPLFLYFYTPYCGPCKELDRKVFTTPDFEESMGNLVAIKVDASTESGKVSAKRYKVHSYPTMVVCKPGGEEIERFFGFSKTAIFLQTIENYLAGRNTATDYRNRALKDPNNLGLAFTAGRELAVRKRAKESIPFLERVYRVDENNATGHVPRAMLLLAKTVYLDTLHQPDKALPILEDLSARYPASYHGSEATYMIARVYIERKQRDEAARVLKERVHIGEHDPIQYFRFGNFCLRYGFLLDVAIPKVEAGLEKHPDAAYLWKTLADLRFRKKDYKGAVAAMEKAVATPKASKSYKKLLETYRKSMTRAQEKK
jgi:tetratricopeptide (TPR) repeat protein